MSGVKELFARVDVYHGLATFTLHIAAPVELTVTSFHMAHDLRVVASPATQEVAAFRPRRRPVADPTSSSQNALARSVPAVVGRAAQVDQLGERDGLAPAPSILPAKSTLGADRKADAALVTLLESAPDVLERRKSSPAGLHCA